MKEPNAEQNKTLDMLRSEIDNLEWVGGDHADEIVFQGDGVDGPSMGYIDLDGKVDWICGG